MKRLVIIFFFSFLGLIGCKYPQVLRSSNSLDFSDYKLSEKLAPIYDSTQQTGVIYKRKTNDSGDDDYFLYLYSNGKVEIYNNSLGENLEFYKEVDGLFTVTDSSNIFFELCYLQKKRFYEWQGIFEGDDLIIYRIHYRNQIGWKKTNITYYRYATF